MHLTRNEHCIYKLFYVLLLILCYFTYYYEITKMVFAKMAQNKSSKAKLTHEFFETFICPIHPRSSNYSQKYNYFTIIFFENACFT